jgi:pyruvate,water dikinase
VLRETTRPGAVRLTDEAASDPQAAGTKAAALARAARAGLPVLPGFVLTTATVAAASDAAAAADAGAALWAELSEDGGRPLVVRSSSPAEDTAASSMAGRFTSVVDVRGWDAFVTAVDCVVASAREVGEEIGRDDVPMAVLVQPLLDARAGGVLFGVDPVTGRSDRRVVAAVSRAPEDLVSGVVTGARFELDRRGRQRAHERGDDDVRLRRRDRHALAQLADQVERLFGAPQDIEWAIDRGGVLHLLQSRPVTTAVAGVPSGPVLGPGPVAETFPDPLARLEQDLWIDPLRRAIGDVFTVLGIAGRSVLDRSPLAVVVDGRVAVDLDLFETAGRARWYQFGRRGRALRTAWRIGRLRAALPALGNDVVARADAILLDAPNAGGLTDRQLVAALVRAGDALASLHAHEMLVGLVLDPHGTRLTGSSVALRVLAQARREGLAEDDIPREHPVVMALVPPRVDPAVQLPPDVSIPPWSPGDEDRASVVREALRLRVRWVQELGARYAWELGERLARSDVLDRPDQVRCLPLESLELVVRDRAVPVRDRLDECEPSFDPLPARFRLSDRGRPIAVLDRHPHQGTGAGGGRKRGPVFVGAPADAPDGSVLVVATLDGRIAPVLPRLHGLVAETGSVLAHLAILAREAGVPTVVGLAGATGCLPPGAMVEVDGRTGAVTKLGSGADGSGRTS